MPSARMSTSNRDAGVDLTAETREVAAEAAEESGDEGGNEKPSVKREDPVSHKKLTTGETEIVK